MNIFNIGLENNIHKSKYLYSNRIIEYVNNNNNGDSLDNIPANIEHLLFRYMVYFGHENGTDNCLSKSTVIAT